VKVNASPTVVALGVVSMAVDKTAKSAHSAMFVGSTVIVQMMSMPLWITGVVHDKVDVDVGNGTIE